MDDLDDDDDWLNDFDDRAIKKISSAMVNASADVLEVPVLSTAEDGREKYCASEGFVPSPIAKTAMKQKQRMIGVDDDDDDCFQREGGRAAEEKTAPTQLTPSSTTQDAYYYDDSNSNNNGNKVDNDEWLNDVSINSVITRRGIDASGGAEVGGVVCDRRANFDGLFGANDGDDSVAFFDTLGCKEEEEERDNNNNYNNDNNSSNSIFCGRGVHYAVANEHGSTTVMNEGSAAEHFCDQNYELQQQQQNYLHQQQERERERDFHERIEASHVPAPKLENNDDFLNDFAEVSQQPSFLMPTIQAHSQVIENHHQQQQQRPYEPPSEFGAPPPLLFTPPPPQQQQQQPPVSAQQQNSIVPQQEAEVVPQPHVIPPPAKALAYEQPSVFGAPPPLLFTPPPQAAYEPPSEFNNSAPPPHHYQPLSKSDFGVSQPLQKAYEPPNNFGIPHQQAYQPPDDFGLPPPLIQPPQQQQFQQQFQHNIVRNSNNDYNSKSNNNNNSTMMNGLASGHAPGNESSLPGMARSPHGKPPHRCITFGFGGSLAIVSRTSESSFSLATYSSKEMFSSSNEFSAREFLAIANDEDFFLDKSDAINMNDDLLCQKCESLASECASSSPLNGESELWRILSIFLSRKKSFDSLRKFGETAFKADIANILRRQDGAATISPTSSIAAASIFERDVSPAILIEIERQVSIGNAISALDIALTHKLWNVAVRVARLTRDETIISDTSFRAIQETTQLGSPMRVLELISIGRADVAVRDVITTTGISERWREIIAIIALNSSNMDKTITSGLVTIGDSFRAHNKYSFIAPLCYLLSGEVWPKDEARMRLIGGGDSGPCSDPRAYHRTLLAERIMLSSVQDKGGSEALKASLSMLLPIQRMKIYYCVLLAEFGNFHVALATLKSVQKNLKLVRDDSSSTANGVSVDSILAHAIDLEKRIREKLGQGVIKGKIANVGKKIVGGLSRFVGGTVDALFGGDDADTIGSRGVDSAFHQRSNSQDNGFTQRNSYGSSSSLLSNDASGNHSRSHSQASLGDFQQQQSYEPPSDFGVPPKVHHLQQQQQHHQQQQSQEQGAFKIVKSFSKLFSAAVPAPEKAYEGPKAPAPQGLLENIFYYDENLKQWVDKSSNASNVVTTTTLPPASSLAPPPMVAGGDLRAGVPIHERARYVSTYHQQQPPPLPQNEFQEMRLE
jgi:hypothetical protein